MAELTIRGRLCESVFTAFGADENTATVALSVVLSRSPAFLKALAIDLGVRPSIVAKIQAQRFDIDRGFSDVEVRTPDYHLIIEAKVGWQLPTTEQLTRYSARFEPQIQKILMTVSAASQHYANRTQQQEIAGVRLVHRSWEDVSKIALQAHKSTRSLTEKLWISELCVALRGYQHMKNQYSNSVYIVSLSRKPVRAGAAFNWIDIVNGRHYYHPFASGWPMTSPNYLGFRYDGSLQAICHVDSVQIVKSPSEIDPRWTESDGVDYVVYSLGPRFAPASTLPTGPLYPSGRTWADLDLLLSGEASSIHDAAALSRARTNRDDEDLR